MPNGKIFRLARLSDKQVVQLFIKLNDEFDGGTIEFFGPNSLGTNFEGIEELDLPLNSHFLTRAYLSFAGKGLQLDFRRGISTGNFDVRQPSVYFDELNLTLDQYRKDPTMQDLLDISQIIESFGTVVQPKGDVTNFDGATDVIAAEVAKLAGIAAELTIGADATRRELESERLALRKAFDADKATLDAAYQDKEDQLETERQKLEVLREELGDREHKHVRRQLRDTITKDLQAEITEPKSSNRSYIYTMLTVLVSLIAATSFGFLAYQTQNAIGNLPLDIVRDPVTDSIISSSLSNSPQAYLLYLKLFAASGAGFGLFVYTISWLRRLSDDATRHQQQLQRHVFDMNRASWTIETILELSGSELPEIPEIWLQSVTSNLFEHGDVKKDETGSLQALAALLNVTSEAEIGPDGPKFKLNRRGAKKAASEFGS